MKVYLASWFSSKDERKKQAQELRALGIGVTSRWLEETAKPNSDLKDFDDEYLRTTATMDIDDIRDADVFVLFTVDPNDGPCYRRGGRHWETGFACGVGKPILLVGPKENIFHHLSFVAQVDSWEAAKESLLWISAATYHDLSWFRL
jgi:nucleoside 2-deoxyribosyltransferase